MLIYEPPVHGTLCSSPDLMGMRGRKRIQEANHAGRKSSGRKLALYSPMVYSAHVTREKRWRQPSGW